MSISRSELCLLLDIFVNLMKNTHLSDCILYFERRKETRLQPLLNAKNLKNVIGKKFGFSATFFVLYGPKNKFKKYTDFKGFSSSFGLTLFHARVTVSVSSLSMSPGFGFSSSLFGFSFGGSKGYFSEGLTKAARKINTSMLKKFEAKSKI